MPGIRHIAFDGDDTLWHHEQLYALTQERFRELVRRHVPAADVDDRLYATEMHNLELFGYGVKGFTLSMIETAIELTEGRIPAADLAELIAWGKEMLARPVELIEGVHAALDALDGRFELMVVTKGDLFDQESKLARSGLAERFAHIEIVSEKDEATYRRLLDRRRVDRDGFLMVGNSMRSDVLPVVRIGARAVHVPYPLTWSHEVVRDDALPAGAFRLGNLAELPGLVETIDG
mgnify:CR=1 FL=1